MIVKQEFKIIGQVLPIDKSLYLDGVEVDYIGQEQVRVCLPNSKVMVDVVYVEGVGLSVGVYKGTAAEEVTIGSGKRSSRYLCSRR